MHRKDHRLYRINKQDSISGVYLFYFFSESKIIRIKVEEEMQKVGR